MAQPLHILVVDDEPEITAWLKDVLVRFGHRVETAASGTEALNFINAALRANDRYQLLLLDVHLPLLDGLGVLRELRRNKDYTDAALFTGNHALLPQLDVEAQKLGCLMVLPKPIDTAQLTQLVEFVGLRQGRVIAPPPTAAPPPPPPVSALPPPPGPTPSPSPLSPLPQQGYAPLQEQHSDSAEYLPTSTRQQTPRPETQVQVNARRTQQYFETDGQQAMPRFGSQRAPGLPPVPQGLPPVPGSSYPEPPARQPVSPRPAFPPAAPAAQQPQRPAYPSPPPAAPPQRPAYPSPPPAAPPQNSQFAQRRADDPRYTSRAAQPSAGYDPRQTQGLPPVPSAPVAQPPARDARMTSGQLPPPPGTTPYQAPPDPRRSSRVMQPPAAMPPQQRTSDPRRTSGVLPPAPANPPRRALPLEEPAEPNTAGYAPHTAPQRPPGESDAAQSSRLRRTVVGSATPPPPSEGTGSMERSRLVACAYCRGSFRAVLKPTPYNLVCVHCGQLNRIDP